MSVKIFIGDGLIEEKPILIDEGKTVLIKYNDAVRGKDRGRNLAPTRTISVKDNFGNIIFENTEDNPYYWGEDKINQEIDEAYQELLDETEDIQI